MKGPKVIVTSESKTGRNTRFVDTRAKNEMTRTQFVHGIEAGKFPDYHVRVLNGVKTPVSNPDGSSRNNLG